MEERTLYERLGGIYSIAAVVDHFGNELAKDPIAGADSSNEFIRDWYANRSWRAAGFKVLTTLWVAQKAGGPYHYINSISWIDSLDLEPTHFLMKLTPEEFDAAGQVLARTLDHFDVGEEEKNEVLNAFVAHRQEVTSGSIKASGEAGGGPKETSGESGRASNQATGEAHNPS